MFGSLVLPIIQIGLIVVMVFGGPQQAIDGVTTPSTACPSVESYDEQRQLARKGQGGAWVSFLEENECRRLKPNIPVNVYSLDNREDVVCIRTEVNKENGGWDRCMFVSSNDVGEPTNE